MVKQTFKIEIEGKDLGECVQKLKALKKLAPMDGPVLQGLGENGPALLSDEEYGPIIRESLGIQQ